MANESDDQGCSKEETASWSKGQASEISWSCDEESGSGEFSDNQKDWKEKKQMKEKDDMIVKFDKVVVKKEASNMSKWNCCRKQNTEFWQDMIIYLLDSSCQNEEAEQKQKHTCFN